MTRREFLRCGLGGVVAAPAVVSGGCWRRRPEAGSAAESGEGSVEESDVPVAGVAGAPAYVKLGVQEIDRRAAALRDRAAKCTLCPRECGADRAAGESGICRAGLEAVVSGVAPHHGEEAPLSGRRGSGTVFLTHCNLECVFCINFEVSHLGRGRVLSTDTLADRMLDLQEQGCHNINWVTPTHQIPALVEALSAATRRGLRVPLVYNCGGYESAAVLDLLDGVVDIYMPDAKYGSNEPGRAYSGVPDYWDRCREALAVMHRQVGDLRIDAGGLATRGLFVRHLVMPNDVCRSAEVMAFLASLSTDTYVNVMGQYRPVFRAGEFEAIARRITRDEYGAVVAAARQVGLHRGFPESSVL